MSLMVFGTEHRAPASMSPPQGALGGDNVIQTLVGAEYLTDEDRMDVLHTNAHEVVPAFGKV